MENAGRPAELREFISASTDARYLFHEAIIHRHEILNLMRAAKKIREVFSLLMPDFFAYCLGQGVGIRKYLLAGPVRDLVSVQITDDPIERGSDRFKKLGRTITAFSACSQEPVALPIEVRRHSENVANDGHLANLERVAPSQLKRGSWPAARRRHCSETLARGNAGGIGDLLHVCCAGAAICAVVAYAHNAALNERRELCSQNGE